ncbi:ribosomal protein L37E [Flavobacterium arsenatis]|uniref:Ribosomal protein L37E n=1 Tax=Flavobacterium arsenatis TaxID=1484332 RepID=A0ABU1TU04_9FLAO|nr:DUF3667 domain-containing protein [Flavobacterium arsenatis]MDR6969325.1 ribosomal protein L37E [Flavobacterium arsenatis]
MGKHHIREDNVCQNCGYIVENRYCSNCSQENTETRQSFGYVVKHFFEDFTHYDNAFWKTIKYLLFYPAKLTKEYLSGKRMSFVPPVKLYIFISFITFLLPKLLPEINVNDYPIEISESNIASQKTQIKAWDRKKYSSFEEFDSIQKTLPKEQRLSDTKYWLSKKTFEFYEKTSNESLANRIYETSMNGLPKFIFLYMPIFCFSLWLFHNKKKWMLFDHAIFTLHYIGFILLTVTISVTCIENFMSHVFNTKTFNLLSDINSFLTLGWIVAYFFIAHKRMYQEKNSISFIKSTILFSLNLFLAIVLTFSTVLYIIFKTI